MADREHVQTANRCVYDTCDALGHPSVNACRHAHVAYVRAVCNNRRDITVPKTTVRFTSYPRTEPPPSFIAGVVAAFRQCEASICSEALLKGLTSDEVLQVLRPQLETLGFQVEAGKNREQKIERPVFFGENGTPTLRYQIDAYHPTWRCGFEVEAGRAWMGNAIYRDLIQALVMVQVDHLVLAVSNSYKYLSGGKAQLSADYKNTCAVADALYMHSRLKLPYGLTVIGY